MVLLEAAYFSKPIIASHVGGVNEVIQDGQSGLLVIPELTLWPIWEASAGFSLNTPFGYVNLNVRYPLGYLYTPQWVF